MLIKGKFKGQHDSLGYKKDKLYTLSFGITRVHVGIVLLERIIITPISKGAEVCEYSTLKSFLKNWEVL